jgi:hypothetical protein
LPEQVVVHFDQIVILLSKVLIERCELPHEVADGVSPNPQSGKAADDKKQESGR